MWTSRQKFVNSYRKPVNRRLWFAALLGILLASSPVTAQWPSRPKKDTPTPSQPAQPAPSTPREPDSAPVPARRAGWSIVLESHSGPDAAARAQERLGPVASDAGRSDVFIRTTQRGAAIVAGSYSSPESPEARADLEAIRAHVVRGTRPFSQAFFAPPKEPVDPGRIPELNLLAAKQTFGRDKEYTLQIAFYQSKKPDDAKRAAEQAALQLRRDGELAFYYHGPTMSLVTVGLFTDRDFDQALRPRNPAILALQERYPYNLHNGEYPIIERRPGQPETKQPSRMVAVP